MRIAAVLLLMAGCASSARVDFSTDPRDCPLRIERTDDGALLYEGRTPVNVEIQWPQGESVPVRLSGRVPGAKKLALMLLELNRPDPGTQRRNLVPGPDGSWSHEMSFRRRGQYSFTLWPAD